MLTVLSFECLRVLQSASYRPNRGYAKILLSVYFLSLALSGVVVAIFHVFKLPEYAVTIVYFVLAVPWTFIKRKCPLKLTKRIWRIIAVQLAIVFLLCYFVGNAFFVAGLPILTIISWAICLPIDNAIAKYYVRKATRKLASSNVTVIAVTGSYGKTSVKDMLTALLDDAVSPKGSCNTPLGIAKFVNSADLYYAKYLILEFGARQKGDIAELCALFKPACGIVTGVCPQHLSTFKTFDNVLQTKRELVEALPKEGFCVLNSADEYARSYADYGECRKVLSTDNVAVETETIGLDGTTLSVTYGKTTKKVTLPQITAYVADTFAICLQTALQLKQCFTKSVARSVLVTQTPHRMQLSRGANGYIIDDSYNGSIVGVTSCCKTLNYFDCSKVVITQGLVECGKQRKRMNVECGRVLGKACNVAIVLGRNAKFLSDGLSQTDCKVVLAKNLTEAVSLAQPYINNGILLFQNDLPDAVNV